MDYYQICLMAAVLMKGTNDYEDRSYMDGWRTGQRDLVSQLLKNNPEQRKKVAETIRQMRAYERAAA